MEKKQKEKQPAMVSYLAYEAAGARYERSEKRHIIMSIIESIIMFACILIVSRRGSRHGE